MSGRRRAREGGFTLLELVIAMLVMSIGIAALVGVLGTAFKSTAIDVHRTDATSIAAQALSQLEVSPNPGSGPLPNVTSNNESYTVTAQVVPTTASNGTVNAYPTLTVTVAWTDQGGQHNLTQSSAEYPTAPSTTVGGCLPVTGVTPTFNAPSSGDPSLDVSWYEPTGATPVLKWQVQVTPEGRATWTTPVPDEQPLPPGALHQIEIGGLAATGSYDVQVIAVTPCPGPPFAATPGATRVTPASSDSSCSPGSFTLGPAVVARTPTGPPPGTLTSNITVTVTTPVPCPSGFTVTVNATKPPPPTAPVIVQAALAQSPSGSYSYVGTLTGSSASWDLGTHIVNLYAGSTTTGPVIATAELCVTEQGVATC